MKLDDFGYTLPPEMIAQRPVSPRDKAKLMVIDRKKGTIFHDVFSGIGKYLPSQSLIVLNDSKVIPARLFGRRPAGGEVEIFLLNKLSDGYSFKTMIRPLKKVKVGEKIKIGKNGLYAQLVDPAERIVRFNKKNILRYLGRIGHMPLPPYIKRPDTALDKKDYQTVYAKKPGSVASPTAGLHFTRSLLNRLKKDGHVFEKITLHVNYATFKPVEEPDIIDHRMHKESYCVTVRARNAIRKASTQGKKIVAIGTTSCRVLETLGGTAQCSGETDIFIYPGYRFVNTDILITNFHLPYSTLLMLVYAFGGSELIKRAYREAVSRKYRFYSYGDAMMIL